MLDDRKAAVLRAVVREYIETAQPVGSAHVARSTGLGVSPATVRNEMAALEREGYLTQPHTSAGRIPTDQGYRFFVDQLTGPGALPAAQRLQVKEFFAKAHGELEQMLHDTSSLLSGLTSYAALVLAPPSERATVRSVQVVGLTDRVAMVVVVLSNGAVETVRQVLTILEQQYVVVSLLREVIDIDGEQRISVSIGTELGVQPLAECSIVVAPYEIEGQPLGTVGVLGPTRMNYPQAMAAVAVVSERLGRSLSA